MSLFKLKQEFFDDNDTNHGEYVEEEEEVTVVKVEAEEKIEVVKEKVVVLQVVVRKIVLKNNIGKEVERWVRRKIEDTEHVGIKQITEQVFCTEEELKIDLVSQMVTDLEQREICENIDDCQFMNGRCEKQDFPEYILGV